MTKKHSDDFGDWLDRICRIPSATEATQVDRAFNRFNHLDLARISHVELLRERSKARLRLVVEDEPSPEATQWLTERLLRIEVRLRAR